MDIIDIITTVIEFSQKEEEFSDEIKAIRATLESLKLTIRQVDQQQLPEHMTIILNENLEEASDLLKKVSDQNTRSWWTTFRNMLPGSNLQKLKEKNQQLLHIINLLNLHLNALKTNKRAASSPYIEDSELFQGAEPTKKLRISSSYSRIQQHSMKNVLASQPIIPRQLNVQKGIQLQRRLSEPNSVGDSDRKAAFKLKLLCDKKVGEVLSQIENLETVVENYWEDDKDQIIYAFHRFNFPDIPSEELMKMSKDHAIITGSRYKKQKTDENDPNIGNTSTSDKDEFEYKFILKDQSLNGTFYLKNYSLKESSIQGIEINAEFVTLKKGTEIELEHGDIIGLILQKPKCDELIFGFQFLTN